MERPYPGDDWRGWIEGRYDRPSNGRRQPGRDRGGAEAEFHAGTIKFTCPYCRHTGAVAFRVYGPSATFVCRSCLAEGDLERHAEGDLERHAEARLVDQYRTYMEYSRIRDEEDPAKARRRLRKLAREYGFVDRQNRPLPGLFGSVMDHAVDRKWLGSFMLVPYRESCRWADDNTIPKYATLVLQTKETNTAPAEGIYVVPLLFRIG